MDQLDRHGGAQHALGVGPRGAGREKDEQRPQSLAPGADRGAGVLGEQRAV
jgi:hypothetical protein